MMLASTVQFSRYGRSRPCDARGDEGTGPGRGQSHQQHGGRSLRTQQRARPGRRRRHPSVPEDVLTGLSDDLTE
jgi:hypothetical protein